ncbi:MAG: SDR family oxidoreductase [Bacteroidales bacterium]|nr:SDR family oxidoreductase [Bacteroidales bacterium]MCF8396527.1 SDR family oxidoreductase [Bacteroidales bacterium]
MKILLTGTTGYIGKRLLNVLLAKGYEIVCCVRDKQRFDATPYDPGKVSVIEVDFLDPGTLGRIPEDIDAAYYLIHSMSAGNADFEQLEKETAQNFRDRLQQTNIKQVIYLSGIVNEDKLSKHLRSRKQVEDILKQGSYHLTTLRAGIIVGSGSASFEIIRDLVEKLPVMIAPRWLNTRSQPLAVRNVLQFLSGVLLREDTYDQSFDIGGPEILTYKEMLLKFARVRKLKRFIIPVPVMTPRLSSYWLYFVTSTSYKLAINLVNSMKVEIVGKANDLHERLGIELIYYEDAVKKAFDKIEQQEVLSSWKDAQSSNLLRNGISKLIQVPEYGCYRDERSAKVRSEAATLEKIWSIGGRNGWYYANRLWALRGLMDKMVGGVGLRRGRKNQTDLNAGDALDFWRVLWASRQEKRLLLYAEMKLPGEAWLEFHIRDGVLYQTATFRPLGLWGRMYWFAVLPFHGIVFKGMINKIAA